ncbi:MAG: VOC family protein, partial [Bryobacteraceae bacterium]
GLMVQPEAIGGANTQTCYLTIPDVASHHARAEGAGAKVVIEPQDDGLGGRVYTCRDLEGHLWSFGTRTYGVAQEAASAFEPAELGPSHPSTAIASPQRHIARGSEKRGRLLRDIAIAAAAGILVSGGWAYYDTYARSALREASTASAATAARLDDAVKQVADERRRRSVAEADSTEAAMRLAEERTVVAQLRQTAQRASADLADMRRQKDEAARALEAANDLSQKHQLARDRAEAQVAAAKVQIAAAEAKLARASEETAEAARVQLAKEQSGDATLKEQLQEAKTALIDANRTIEELRAGQLEPMLPDSGDPVAENSSCVLAVQGKIPASHKGPNTWPAVNLGRLCRGAEASVEPAKCFEQIMRGTVNWGAGTIWATTNALALCGGTRNARRTLDCFSREVSSSQTWQVAIRQCKANK